MAALLGCFAYRPFSRCLPCDRGEIDLDRRQPLPQRVRLLLKDAPVPIRPLQRSLQGGQRLRYINRYIPLWRPFPA